MPTRKKCRHCNTENTENALYCIACGKYLSVNKFNCNELQEMCGYGSLSSTPANIDLENSNSLLNTSSSENEEYIVICPVCQCHSPTKKETLPISCTNCGYYFQVGLDVILKKDSMKKNVLVGTVGNNSIDSDKSKTNLNVSAQKADISTRKMPMPVVNKDSSQLRLFWMNRNNEMPIQIPDKGATLGSKGLLLNNISGDNLFMIWHTVTGWYLRIISGNVLYNGAPINLNIDKRLLNNDSLIIGNEQFRVEVI